MLTVRHRRSEIPFVPHEEMQRCLVNLGLYQLAMVPQTKIDQSLMHGLVISPNFIYIFGRIWSLKLSLFY